MPAAQRGGSLKGEVGSRLNYELPIIPSGTAGELTAFSSTATLDVRTDAPVGNNLAVSVLPLGTGMQTIAVRIGARGPILGAVPFQAFYLNRQAMLRAPVIGWLENGKTMGRPTIALGALEMRPYVEGVDFAFDMFAHSSRFIDSATKFSVNSSGGPSTIGEPGFSVTTDPVTGESVGRFEYRIISPQSETQFCHTITVHQE